MSDRINRHRSSHDIDIKPCIDYLFKVTLKNLVYKWKPMLTLHVPIHQVIASEDWNGMREDFKMASDVITFRVDYAPRVSTQGRHSWSLLDYTIQIRATICPPMDTIFKIDLCNPEIRTTDKFLPANWNESPKFILHMTKSKSSNDRQSLVYFYLTLKSLSLNVSWPVQKAAKSDREEDPSAKSSSRRSEEKQVMWGKQNIYIADLLKFSLESELNISLKTFWELQCLSCRQRRSATEPTIFGENGQVWNKEDQVYITFEVLVWIQNHSFIPQIWEGGDLEVESTTPTYSKVDEGRSSNFTSKNTQLMQGGDRAWGGREKRFLSLVCISHDFHHDLLEGPPCLRRWGKCQRALHLPRNLFLIMS